jgi:hypothetical protein
MLDIVLSPQLPQSVALGLLKAVSGVIAGLGHPFYLCAQFLGPRPRLVAVGPRPPVQELPGFPGVDPVAHHGQETAIHLAVDVAWKTAPPRSELAPGHEQLASIHKVDTSTLLAVLGIAWLIAKPFILRVLPMVNTYD